MKFVKSILTSFAANMFGLFVSFLTIVVTARLLGQSGNGVWGIATTFIGTAGILFGFGIHASNVYLMGKDRGNVNNILGVNFVIMLFALAGMVLIFVLNLFFHFPFFQGLYGWTLVLVLCTVPLYVIKTSLYYMLLGTEEVIEYNKIMMLDKAVAFALLTVFIFIFKSAEYIILSNFVAVCIMICRVSYILFVKKGFRVSFDKSTFKEMFSYGFKSQIGNLIQNINYRLDVFVCNSFLSLAQVGLYTKATNLGETMWRVSGSVGIVVLPYAANSKDSAKTNEFMNKVIRVTFAFVIICALILTAISKPLIVMFLSKEFLGSVTPFMLIIPGISIFAINNILNSYFAGSGLIEKNIIASGVAGVITIILDFTLIPIFGINGAAITSSISYTVCTIISLYFYTKHTQSKLIDVLLIKRADIEEIKTKLRSRKKLKSA
jgi:O-antigen/teichoic acid export membrane protein